jgi:hypothetical protein
MPDLIDLYCPPTVPDADAFKPQRVRLATSGWNSYEVDARVHDGLAVHAAHWTIRDHCDRRDAAGLTHVGTGMSLGAFPNEAAALAVACRVTALPEWAAIRDLKQHKITKAHGQRLARAMRPILADYPAPQDGFRYCCPCGRCEQATDGE